MVNSTFLKDHDNITISSFHNYCATLSVASFIAEQVINDHAQDHFNEKIIKIISECYPQIVIKNIQDLKTVLLSLSREKQNLFLSYALFEAIEDTSKNFIPYESFDGLTPDELKPYAELLGFSLIHVYESINSKQSIIIHDSSIKTDVDNEDTPTMSMQHKISENYETNSKKHNLYRQNIAKQNICVTHDIGQDGAFNNFNAGEEFSSQTHFTRLYVNEYRSNEKPLDDDFMFEPQSRSSNINYLVKSIAFNTSTKEFIESDSDICKIYENLDKLRDIVYSLKKQSLNDDFKLLSLKIKALTKNPTHSNNSQTSDEISKIGKKIIAEIKRSNFSTEILYLVYSLFEQIQSLIGSVMSQKPIQHLAKWFSLFSSKNLAIQTQPDSPTDRAIKHVNTILVSAR